MQSKIKTVQQHILDEERMHPGASGDFTGLLTSLTLAAKIISREVNKAGLVKILGETGEVNVHGEAVQKLDEFAQQTVCRAMGHNGHLCVMASEEAQNIIPIPDGSTRGKYVLMFDPLDGSSNIDVNACIGTIFSIHHKITKDHEDGSLEDCLQKGSDQIGAGYFIYGSSTMMVYSINEGNMHFWDAGTRRYIEHLKEDRKDRGHPYSLRYIGSLVADFHRNLLKGGIFLYPGPKGKLRLLYEASPLAMIVEQAGGAASTGEQRILDIQPTSLHERVPLIIGSREDVEQYNQFYKEAQKSAAD